MRIIKTYESFFSKFFSKKDDGEKLDINNYDWQYFFQDFIDNYGITVTPSGFFKPNKVLKYSTFLFKMSFLYRKKFPTFWYGTEGQSSLVALGDLKEPFLDLIRRVESLDGKISVISYDFDTISIYISTNTFDSFKN